MYYVGIDVAKRFSVVAIKNSNDKIVKKGYVVKHNEKGFNDFLSLLKKLDNDKNNFLLGLEATGHYFENLFEFLKNQGYNIKLLNPWQTNRFKEMHNLNFNKTDNIDSLIIASLLKSGMFKSGYVSDELYQSIKQLNRMKIKLIDDINSIQKQILSILDIVFPEFNDIIDPFSKTGLILLKKYPTAIDYKYTNEKRILKLFRGIKGNSFNIDKASLLLITAKKSIYSGKAKEARTKVLLTLITQLEFYQSQLNDIKISLEEILQIKKNENKNFNDVDDNINSNENLFYQKIQNLYTIDGVADATISTILAEVGNIDRFPTLSKFLSYIGIIPKLNESGNSKKKPKLSKKGSHYAKKALYLAAVASVKHNEALKQIYKNKLNQGKSTKEALIIVAKKLASIIYGIWKNNTPYNPSRVFISGSILQQQ
jgi:transposase